MFMLELLTALGLFLLGLRLSAFFSGAETGFYRVSHVRLSLDARSGDQTAESVLRFLREPGNFVATTLVGNNVANYLTTLAIGIGTIACFGEEVGGIEIAITLLLTPVVFVLGELIPKNLYFRAPLRLLRRDAKWFRFFYLLFLPVSFPLMLLTRAIEYFAGDSARRFELVLGRKPLAQFLSQGHREGLIGDVQNRLVHGLMDTASEAASSAMTPLARVLGVSDASSREEISDYGRRFGLTTVLLHRDGDSRAWYGYVRMIDAAVRREPVSSLVVEMPHIREDARKLEALIALRSENKQFGLMVNSQEEVVGVINVRGLTEQLFRPEQLTPAAESRA